VSAAEVYGSSTVRTRRTAAQLEAVDAAIVSAVAADHPVTLRGVYYRVVSAGAVDKTELAYRLVGRRLLQLRRLGDVCYEDITDGTRWITKPDSWNDVETMLADAAASYRRALWHDQAVAVQMFTEKDAISGVILPVTERWDVPLGVVKGYCSESFAYSVAASIRGAGKDVAVYQLGDHDPSGVDAWRDLRRKVLGFLGEDDVAAADGDWSSFRDAAGAWRSVMFERLAVTPWQISALDLPTRPTKRSDSRARWFSGGSVEVDAIPAPELRRIVEEAITGWVDQEALRVTRAAENSERELLYAMLGEVGKP
jgi:hypothetical protein